MSSVRFYNADKKFLLTNKKLLSHSVLFVFSNENKVLNSLSIIFCSDEYLLSMNRQFLHHNYYTDILTFDLSSGEAVDGEIYISLDRVNENSSAHSVSFEQELQRIVYHGALHLCGYLDKTPHEKQIMTEKENFYLAHFSTFHVKQN